MAPKTLLCELTDVQVEHLLGLGTGLPLVMLRCVSDQAQLDGQISPTQAREIAGHLLEAAARSEYEYDLWTGARATGLDPGACTHLLHIVRSGERRRMEDPDA
jgi:hypothetical protein